MSPTSAVLDREPITAEESDTLNLLKMEEMLQARPMTHRPRLVGPAGEEVELPEPIFEILRGVVPHLLQGDGIVFVPHHKLLTTLEAANLLGFSRQYLVRLLDRGEIPYTKTGTHRRLRLGDVIEYKKRHDREVDKGLSALTQLSQQYGLYGVARERHAANG